MEAYPGKWVMYFDGSFSYHGAGVGVYIVAPTGEEFWYAIQMLFNKGRATNNTAEYEGLIAGLKLAAGLGVRRLVVRGDSHLVIKQVTKDYA